MEREEFKARTKQFALRIIRLSEKLQKIGGSARILSKQLLRSGTSVGAITGQPVSPKAATIF